MPTIRRAVSADADALADLAAVTFPLACPPHMTRERIAEFLAEHLSAVRFAAYLSDATRSLFVAEDADGRLVGYTMNVAGEPADPDVAAAISLRPTVELSKCYALPSAQGTGISARLVAASRDDARARGARGIWLGVNQLNDRANRFYDKQGFVQVGVKRFLVGGVYEDDYVRERAL